MKIHVEQIEIVKLPLSSKMDADFGLKIRIFFRIEKKKKFHFNFYFFERFRQSCGKSKNVTQRSRIFLFSFGGDSRETIWNRKIISI